MSNWLSRTIELRSTSKSQEQFLGPRIMHLIGELIGKISISTPNIYLAKGEGLLMNTDNIFDIKQIDVKEQLLQYLEVPNSLTFEQKMYSGDSIHTDGLMQCNIQKKPT